MTNKELEKKFKELEKKLAITQKALLDTQEALLKLAETVYRAKAVLHVHDVIDDLDSSYIKGELSDDEYKEKYKEQNSLSNLLNQMFMFPTNEEH